MNPVLKTIQERSSIRRYKDTPLTEEELFLLKDAVLAAPTARNLQGLRYYFITDRSIIKQIDNVLSLARGVHDDGTSENGRHQSGAQTFCRRVLLMK
jgi:nitroreductase